MNSYAVLKFAHVSFVAISITLFVFRFVQMNVSADRTPIRVLRILPHINDTALLASALGMLYVARLSPFDTPWLSAKLVALCLYIFVGSVCMRSVPGSRRNVLSFVAAVLILVYILSVALTKQLLF